MSDGVRGSEGGGGRLISVGVVMMEECVSEVSSDMTKMVETTRTGSQLVAERFAGIAGECYCSRRTRRIEVTMEIAGRSE